MAHDFERLDAVVVELDVDTCANTYGLSPCTAGITHADTALDALPNTLTLAAGASAVADAYNGQVLALTGGTGAGQERLVSDYAEATNLLTYSEQFDNAVWTKQATTITTNAATAPDGTLTAEKVIGTAGAAQHRIAFDDQVTLAAGVYTSSVFAKAAEYGYIGLTLFDGAYRRAQFNLTTGAISQLLNATATAENVGNGWWRLSITGTLTGDLQDASDASGFWPHATDTTPSASTTQDGTSGIYIWGAQLEQSATLGPYVATTTASATGKVATVASNWSAEYLSLSGAVSNWAETPHKAAFNTVTGDWEIEATVTIGGDNLSTTPGVMSRVYPGSTTTIPWVLGFNYSTSAVSATSRVPYAAFYVSGVWHRAVGPSALTVGQTYSLRGVHRGTSIELWVDGVLVTSTPGVPAATPINTSSLRIGRRWDIDHCFNGDIHSATIRNGVDGAGNLIASFNAADALIGDTSFESSTTGETWTINRSGAIPARLAPVPDATTTYAVIDRAAGCYNTFQTCQDRANYGRATRTVSFCNQGMPPIVGATVRPYLRSINSASTEISQSKGLAIRGQTTVALTDESASDHLDDPYAATRTAPAAGSWWGRFMARNLNVSGRFARVRRGKVSQPFSWGDFVSELYVITAINGPSAKGDVSLVLNDPIKLLDRAKYPLPSDGKLDADFFAYSHVGVAQSGSTSTTIVLALGASAVDSAYNGQEVFISQNTGTGQRRTISAYVGATRTATVAAWSVTPDNTSVYEVSPLQLTVTSGKGAQYNDPATSGKREFIRVKDEVIEYTVKTGDVLSWPDATYRSQFGTLREYPATEKDKGIKQAAKLGELVQQAEAFINLSVSATVERLLNSAGVVDTYIDLVQLGSEDATWLGTGSLITACIASPEDTAKLLADLLVDLNSSMWWDSVGQKVKFKVNTPQISATVPTLTDNDLIEGSLTLRRKDGERITAAAVYFDLKAATSDLKVPSNYLQSQIAIDLNAESANEYGDVRPSVKNSRWMTAQNANAVASGVSRKVGRLRDAPIQFSFKLHKGAAITIGELVSISTSDFVDAAGQPATTLVRIIKIDEEENKVSYEAESTSFALRYGFIAPNGQPNYGTASAAQREYAYISVTATGKMTNGDNGYTII